VLRTDVLELINSGQAWAFIGSGVSADAGLPGWGELVSGVVGLLTAEEKTALLYGSGPFDSAHACRDWKRCLSAIEGVAGRPRLEDLVRQLLSSRPAPGPLMEILADWPFAGYLTTNYEGLAEAAIAPKAPGWAPVGNTPEEIRKVSRGAGQLVWHIHGSLDLPPNASKLILTAKDYDDLYLDTSPLVVQLQAFLLQHRVVFFGFGFQDEELGRLLRLTARYCNPALPTVAFLRDTDGPDRQRLFDENHVDVVPYPGSGDNHGALRPLLQTYNAFVLSRTLRYGQPLRPVPSYDPETTGLMVYNSLVLRGGARLPQDVAGTLLRAHVLALLKYRGAVSDSALIQDLEEKARLVIDSGVTSARHEAEAAVAKSLTHLASEGLITAEPAVGGRLLRLSPAGHSLVDDQSAAAELRSRQFSTSLLDRSRLLLQDDEAGAQRVAASADAFLRECLEHRALGIALAKTSSGKEQQFQLLALLQSLPRFMETLGGETEAQALIRLIEDLLVATNGPEAAYLGIALQARFGIHLLGYDPDALQTRLNLLADTLFLIDSSTLIHFMARSSSGCGPARLLVARLLEVGASIATTDRLAVEVAEHARWGLEHVASNGSPNPETVFAATGRAGFNRNEFLDGFTAEIAQGESPDFRGYLDRALGKGGSLATDVIVQRAISREGIPCKPLSMWEGFADGLWHDVDELAREITKRRMAFGTWKHDRQVDAEAEALTIVRAVREGNLRAGGRTLADAFFVSPMRGTADLDGTSDFAMNPYGLVQWLNTMAPCPPEELGALFCALVTELADRGMSVVDRPRLRAAVSGMADASKERLAEEAVTHHDLIASLWGAGAPSALREIDGIDAILVEKPYYAKKADQLQLELDRERQAADLARETARLNARDREKLDLLQAAEKQRKLRTLHKQRSAQNRRRK
jgi:hypothetical protein